MQRLFLCSILLLTLCSSANAQIRTKEHVFQPATAQEKFPDSLLDYDAFFVSYNHEIKNIVEVSTSKIFAIETFRKKIKINTQKGLEEHSIISVLKNKSARLVKIDARTIKQNGNVVDLAVSDIKQLDIVQDKDNINLQNIRFSIPGAEIGDEVEYIFAVEYQGLVIGRDVNLYHEIPCMSSSFTYICGKELLTDFRMYNDMGDPVITRTIGEDSFKWTLSNLPGMGDQFAADFTEDLPFIRFAVRMILVNGRAIQGLAQYGIVNNWSEIYDYYVNSFTSARSTSSYRGKSFEGYMMKWKEQNPTMTTDQKLIWLSSMINDSLEIVEMDDEESNSPLMSFVMNKKIDSKNVHNLIRRFLQENKMNFYIGFGRERINGKLDLEFVSGNMIDEVFYAVEFENGDFHFIYPSTTSRKYFIDELPYRLAGSYVVLVGRTNDNASKSQVKKIRLPNNAFSVNTRTTVTSVQVNLSSKEAKVKFKEAITGDFSTRYRPSVLNALKEDNPIEHYSSIGSNSEKIEYDTLYVEKTSKVMPFNFNYCTEGKQVESVFPMGNNVYSIPLSNIVNHFTLYTSDDQRRLNYYAPFMYKDIQKVYLQFEKPVEVLTKDLDQFWVFEDFCNYEINVSKVNDKIILIESKLDFRKPILNASEYETLRNLNKQISKAQGVQFLIKTL